MSRSRFGIITIALAACIAFATRAVEFVVSGFHELAGETAAFVWRSIEPTLRLAMPSTAYAGPSSSHALRHEAGTSRRAADRHI